MNEQFQLLKDIFKALARLIEGGGNPNTVCQWNLMLMLAFGAVDINSGIVLVIHLA